MSRVVSSRVLPKEPPGLTDALPPSKLRGLVRHIRGPLIVDTETSGRYVDDGARVATVSVAFTVGSRETAAELEISGAHVALERVTEGHPAVRRVVQAWGHQALADLLATRGWYGGTQEPTPKQALRFAHWLHDQSDEDGNAWVVSTAWPFDQGSDGKVGLRKVADGQDALWPDAPNLEAEEWIALLDLLLGHRHGLVFHGGKFDLDKLQAGTRPGRYGTGELGVTDELGEYVTTDLDRGVALWHRFRWCTELGCRWTWPLGQDPLTKRPTRGLKPTAHRLWGPKELDERDTVKAWIKKNLPPGMGGRYDLVPWDVIGTYADRDARQTARLYLRQLDDLVDQAAGKRLWTGETWYPRMAVPVKSSSNPEILPKPNATVRSHLVMTTLGAMEKRGLPYDDVLSANQVYELRVRARALASKLPFEPATLPAAKTYYFGDGSTARRGQPAPRLQPYARTDSGEPQMNDEVVKRMLVDGIPGVDLWSDYQKANNAISKWYEPFAEATGPDGRLRTWFKQHGTDSTRFSVERINLQAVPQNYRLEGYAVLDGIPTPRDLVASGVERYAPGLALWELDLAQAELRVAAMWAGCERMLSAMRDGRDLHSETTAELFPKVDPKSHEWGMWRQVGKRGNFSLCFGSGAETFAWMIAKETGIQLPMRESERIVRRWNGIYPEYSRAIDRHMEKVIQRQRRYGRAWLVLANGERRWFARHEDAHKAFNQRVQGSLAQFGIDWMLSTEDYLTGQSGIDPGTAGLVLVIHDSQVLLLPRGQDTVYAERCAQTGRDLWTKWFPDVPGDVEAKQWKTKPTA